MITITVLLAILALALILLGSRPGYGERSGDGDRPG